MTARRRPVILDHDGGADDIIALAFLAAAPLVTLPNNIVGTARNETNDNDAAGRRASLCKSVALEAVVVTDADCFATVAATVSSQVLRLVASSPLVTHSEHLDAPQSISAASFSAVAVGISTLDGQSEPFPDEWRKDCVAIADLPCLNTRELPTMPVPTKADIRSKQLYQPSGCPAKAGQQLMADIVMMRRQNHSVGDDDGVTIVVTGPLSNVAWCLSTYGRAFADAVKEIVIMGGALDVKGNVASLNLPKPGPQNDSSSTTNGSKVAIEDKAAEWNIFWDAPAAKTVLTSPLLHRKIKLFTLDATNHVPVTHDMVRSLARVTCPASDAPHRTSHLAHLFAGSWAQCAYLHLLLEDGMEYFAWDALTAAYVLDETICTFRQTRVDVDADRNSPQLGKTWELTEAQACAAGKSDWPVIDVAENIDRELFYDLVRAVAAVV